MKFLIDNYTKNQILLFQKIQNSKNSKNSIIIETKVKR